VIECKGISNLFLIKFIKSISFAISSLPLSLLASLFLLSSTYFDFSDGRRHIQREKEGG